MTGWHFFHDCSFWEEEGGCPNLLDRNMIPGKIPLDLLLALGEGAAPAGGPALGGPGTVGLMGGHLYPREALTVTTSS